VEGVEGKCMHVLALVAAGFCVDSFTSFLVGEQEVRMSRCLVCCLLFLCICFVSHPVDVLFLRSYSSIWLFVSVSCVG